MTTYIYKETITVSGLVYCKKCNKYMGETRELNPLIKEFVNELNERSRK